jgi:hypothetical protein
LGLFQVFFIRDLTAALERGDYKAVRKMVGTAPGDVGSRIAKGCKADRESQHNDASIYEQYAELIAEFRVEVNTYACHTCDICKRMWREKEVGY